ncbi:MAG: hydroxymethylglutaryl-CoA reductase (NADPH), partial [Paraglaciecola sp.]
MSDDNRIPRNSENDHTLEMAEVRRQFIKQKTGAELTHTGQFSIDPAVLPGNIENFIGIV